MHAPVKFNCNHNTASITIVDAFGLCTLHFSDTHVSPGVTVNQVLHGVVYENETSEKTPHDVKIVSTITGITYIATGEFCELLGTAPGTHHDGILTGNTTMKAYEDTSGVGHTFTHNGEDVGVTVESETEN